MPYHCSANTRRRDNHRQRDDPAGEETDSDEKYEGDLTKNRQGMLMSANHTSPKNIDQYIKTCSTDVQAILQKIRRLIKEVAPDAEEKISYQIPAFTLNGKILIYFAAFKQHIRLYPPVKGDGKLQKAMAAYKGEKGNLKFPFSRPMPYALIRKIVKHKVMEVSDKPHSMGAKIAVENLIRPGGVRRVDATMYAATKRAYLKVLPKRPPGLTLAEIQTRLLATLPDNLFPNGAKAGWWAKTVQLDLEAKGVVVRAPTKPVRLYKGNAHSNS
jgi:uncharacterized protein YdhG (YjbR/CyaY superfamily)